MGNTTSEVASGVKAQINSGGQGPELYKYVDFKVHDREIFVWRICLIRRAVESLSMSCALPIERKIIHKLMR